MSSGRKKTPLVGTMILGKDSIAEYNGLINNITSSERKTPLVGTMILGKGSIAENSDLINNIIVANSIDETESSSESSDSDNDNQTISLGDQSVGIQLGGKIFNITNIKSNQCNHIETATFRNGSNGKTKSLNHPNLVFGQDDPIEKNKLNQNQENSSNRVRAITKTCR